MSEDRLVLSTQKSLYKSFEIEVNEKVYQCIKATHPVLAEVNKLDAQITAENDEPIFKIVELLYGVNRKILDELDKREVEDIYFFTKKKFLEIDKERLKLIANSFSGERGKQVKGKIPKNRKRPGNKA